MQKRFLPDGIVPARVHIPAAPGVGLPIPGIVQKIQQSRRVFFLNRLVLREPGAEVPRVSGQQFVHGVPGLCRGFILSAGPIDDVDSRGIRAQSGIFLSQFSGVNGNVVKAENMVPAAADSERVPDEAFVSSLLRGQGVRKAAVPYVIGLAVEMPVRVPGSHQSKERNQLSRLSRQVFYLFPGFHGKHVADAFRIPGLRKLHQLFHGLFFRVVKEADILPIPKPVGPFRHGDENLKNPCNCCKNHNQELQ